MSVFTTARVLAISGALAAILSGWPGSAVRAEPVQRVQDGLKVNGELVLANGKTAADGVVLILHGTLAHHRMETVTALQAALKDRGLNSLAFTLSLGLDDRKGFYDCTLPHRHRHSDATAEIKGWIDWLRGKGATSIVLAGHSRGGNQTAHYLRTDPAPEVKKAVLIAPSTKGQPAAAAVLAPAEGKPDDALVDVPPFLGCVPGKATAAAVRSYYADPAVFDTPALLAGIKVPLLVIAAGADEIVTDLPARMKALPPTPGVEFVVVDGADHFFLEPFSDDVADAIARFVKAGP